MASSNNLASLEPWSFRSTSSFTDSWISEAFARETETFTKALQQSLSTNTITTTEMPTDIYDTYLVKTESAPTGSVSDPDMFPKRRNGVTNGKITKRKSRASKRSPTTFIAADPSNFRQMVQQVTGIQFGDSHMPVNSVLKPEPQRPAANRIQNYSLPTLDTSQFLLDNNNRFARVDRTSPAAVAQPTVSDDFGSFQNFPTLESWTVM